MRFKHSLLALLAAPICLGANMGPTGFDYFNNNKVFVETGSLGGGSIQQALDAGFRTIYSMDIDPLCYATCKNRFATQGRKVRLFLKDSSYQLWEVIRNIREPITFFLDAHNGFPDPNAIGVKNTPLIEELEQIKRHPIKTHTILIDDLHCCGTLYFDYLTVEDLIDKIMEINPNYVISYVDGGNEGEWPNNILVATIEE